MLQEKSVVSLKLELHCGILEKKLSVSFLATDERASEKYQSSQWNLSNFLFSAREITKNKIVASKRLFLCLPTVLYFELRKFWRPVILFMLCPLAGFSTGRINKIANWLLPANWVVLMLLWWYDLWVPHAVQQVKIQVLSFRI